LRLGQASLKVPAAPAEECDRERKTGFASASEAKPETMATCIRCGNDEAHDEQSYCPQCAIASRVEVLSGMRRLGDYLAAWAAFDEWLRAHHGTEPSAA
jgi:ribosomal protein L37E